jgi:hypothetical protein
MGCRSASTRDFPVTLGTGITDVNGVTSTFQISPQPTPLPRLVTLPRPNTHRAGTSRQTPAGPQVAPLAAGDTPRADRPPTAGRRRRPAGRTPGRRADRPRTAGRTPGRGRQAAGAGSLQRSDLAITLVGFDQRPAPNAGSPHTAADAAKCGTNRRGDRQSVPHPNSVWDRPAPWTAARPTPTRDSRGVGQTGWETLADRPARSRRFAPHRPEYCEAWDKQAR